MALSLSRFAAIVCIISSFNRASAQDYYGQNTLPARNVSVGLHFGLSDFWGDVGTSRTADHYSNSYYWQHPHFMGGISVRYAPLPWFAGRLQLSAGQLYASDQYNLKLANENPSTSNKAYLFFARNQTFRSDIYEAAMLGELLPFRMFDDRTLGHLALQPVFLLGGSIFHFDPQAPVQGNNGTYWVGTHDLRLEGEESTLPGASAAWSRTAGALTFGGGLRFEINPAFSLGAEVLWRMTSTDYLDGVSGAYVSPSTYNNYLSSTEADEAQQLGNRSGSLSSTMALGPGDVRGNPKKNDVFSTISLSASFRIAQLADRR